MKNNLCYGIVGNGRMAKHFMQYLRLLNIDFIHWYREKNINDLKKLADKCSPILILINDDAIADFIQQHAFLRKNILIHFSGNLITDLAYGVHPLFSFSNKLHALETYQRIPFMGEKDSPSFETLLPGLQNPYFVIHRNDKIYYHALCVLAGNFTTLLWQKLFSELENKFNIPKEYAFPYLQQITNNLIKDAENALTGPLARGDAKTIEDHLETLKNDSYLEVYRAFVEVYNHRK